MSGETSLSNLLIGMKPVLNDGDYVFCLVQSSFTLDESVLGSFRESEGLTVVMERSRADLLGLRYSYVAAWISLTIHSSLEAVGLTATFSHALADADISCNVIAAFHHDHIFVAKKDAENALAVLEKLANSNLG